MNDLALAAKVVSTVVPSGAGGVVVRDADVFGSRLAELGTLFLKRVLALPEVASVEINRDLGEALVVPVAADRLLVLLERLAQTIRGADSTAAVSAGSIVRDLIVDRPRVTVRRIGSSLTTWAMVHQRPGRVRLRHEDLLKDRGAFERVRMAARDAAGVTRSVASKTTGCVLIEYDPAQTTLSRIMEALDRARHRSSLAGGGDEPKSPGFALANTSVVLAVIGQTSVPALLPACALLLVGSNLETLRAAVRQLGRGRVGLPVLYTGIIAATLASGQFVASAAMSWMLVYWKRAYRDSLTAARAGLLGELLDQPRHTRLAAGDGGGVLEIAIEDLKPGDVFVVGEGESIPADGRIVEGWGLLDERIVTGRGGLSRATSGDLVLAGSTLVAGQARIEVERSAAESRASLLGRAVLAATTPSAGTHAPTPQGESFADRTVTPTLALAGMGMLLGDVTAAGAILRPDYATGVGIAHPLETLQAVALCARHGVLIREAGALERLGAVDLLILDDHPALARGRLEVGMTRVFDGRGDDNVLALAAAAFGELGCDRAGALRRACRLRGVEPPRVVPRDYVPDIAFPHEGHWIKVGDLGATTDARSRPAGGGGDSLPQSLMVGVDGRIAGLIHFHRSDQLEAASAIARLKAKRGIEVGLVSSRPLAQAAALSGALDLDFHAGGFSVDDQVRLLENLRARGRRVAYVGDRDIDPRIAELAQVSFSHLGDNPVNADNTASIWLVGRIGEGLAETWDIARIHERGIRAARGQALIPNLLCVAGAFAWGFTSLASVVLTNLGTYSIHRRTQSSIRRLERQISRAFHHHPNPNREIPPPAPPLASSATTTPAAETST